METVGIIIPTKKRFDEWVRTWGIPDEKYIHLNHIDKSRGCVFSKVLKSKDWYIIDNADEIIKDANYRIRLKDKTGYNNIEDTDPNWTYYIDGMKT